VGVQDDPDRVEAAQEEEYFVEAVSAGTVHGFGAQMPSGAERLPRVQVWMRDAVAVYPLLQVGVQVDPEGVGDGQDATA
jgi:hypothetical protein